MRQTFGLGGEQEGSGLASVLFGDVNPSAKLPFSIAANACEELGAAPAEAMLIGDSEVDVQTARNTGTLAVAVNYGFGTHDRAAYPADVYLDRLTVLPTLLTLPKNQ